MATTIVTKSGSGAPAASDLVAGELAVDLTNGRLYTEDSGGTVLELGLNPNGNVNVTGSVTADTGEITRLGIGVAAHASSALNITSTDQHIRFNNGSELGIIDLDSDGELNIWAHGDGEVINLRTGSGSGTDIVKVTSTGIDVTGNATFGDNGKAIFGAGSDLQIYHDGSHARLREITGDFRIQTTSSGVNALVAKQNAEVEITYAGATKLATTNTGIDVTGVLTADGLTVDVSSGGATATAATLKNNGSGANTKARLDFFAASTRYAGISGGYGASAPEMSFDINGTDVLDITATGIDVTGSVTADGTASSSVPKYTFAGDVNTGLAYIGADAVGLLAAGSRKFYVNATTGYFQNLSGGVNFGSGIDVTGSVTADGLTSSSTVKVDHTGDLTAAIQIGDPATLTSDTGVYFRTSGTAHLTIPASGSLLIDGTSSQQFAKFSGNGDISFYEDTGTTAKLFWDAYAESLGIGTSSPVAPLTVSSIGWI